MKLGYSVDSNENIVLTMTKEDYTYLLLAIGYATGTVSSFKESYIASVEATLDGGLRKTFIELINRLNQGNPQFTPYKT